MRDEPHTSKRFFSFGWGIFVFALLCRLLYLFESADTPTFGIPLIDEKSYYETALAFAGGKGMGEGFFWQPFFYPFFLSSVIFLFGSSVLWIKILQCIVGSVTCVLTYLLGRRIFDERTGILAGAVTAFYGPLIFFDGELLAAGWASFWSVALILVFLMARTGKKPLPFFILGLCGALSVLSRPTFVPFFLAA